MHVNLEGTNSIYQHSHVRAHTYIVSPPLPLTSSLAYSATSFVVKAIASPGYPSAFKSIHEPVLKQ